jgi:dienelactone hydrolase
MSTDMATPTAPLLPPTAEDCCTPSAHPPIAGGDSSGAPLLGQFVVLTPPQAPESSFECYLSFPERKSRGVMLLATDIFGLHAGRHAQICDKLAGAGFIAACPDLFGDGRARAEALNPSCPIKTLPNICGLLCKISWMKRALKLPWDVIARKIEHTLRHVMSEHGRRFPGAAPLAGCGAVGLCWGASVVARLLSDSEAARLPMPIIGGVGFHPSLRGNEGETLVGAVTRPFLLCPAGDDPVNVQPSGALAAVLVARFGTNTIVPFPEMLHGWMPRGPLEQPAIRRDYELGIATMLEFFDDKLPVGGDVACGAPDMAPGLMSQAHSR